MSPGRGGGRGSGSGARRSGKRKPSGGVGRAHGLLLFGGARVGCYACDVTLDDESGRSVCWSIGCDQPGCDRWACHACAGFETLEVGEQYEGDWFCREHANSLREQVLAQALAQAQARAP
eukprot:3113456-Prymnesium_polylepis.1